MQCWWIFDFETDYTNEVEKAIEKGYKIITIDEVWHFTKKSFNLFKGYVKEFMKIKLETSPWENDFESEEEYKRKSMY
jgi:hypothetical protein